MRGRVSHNEKRAEEMLDPRIVDFTYLKPRENPGVFRAIRVSKIKDNGVQYKFYNCYTWYII